MTETDKWGDSWFRELPPDLKVFWEYLRDKCDFSGVWEIDIPLFQFQSKVNLDQAQLIRGLGDRVHIFAEGKKLWIKNFIKHQCKGKLSADCKPHRHIVERLTMHGLLPEFQAFCPTLWEGFMKGSGTLLDKDKDQDKDKLGKGGVGEKGFTKPTFAEVEAYCLERKNGIRPAQFLAFYESNGWKVGKNPMKNWKAAVVTWENSEKRK